MPRISSVPNQEQIETEDTSMSSQAELANGKKIIVYFTNWGVYARNFQVKNLPIDNITDINYGFFDLRKNAKGNYVPTSGDTWADFDQRYTTTEKGLSPLDTWDDKSPYYGNMGQFKKLKNSGKKVSIGLSVGGWSWSKNFSPAMATEDTRKDFIDETIKIFKSYDIFNRLDIDWEYISPGTESYGEPGNISHPDDAKNFGLFLKSMREALDKNGMSKYEITACVTANPKKMDALPIKEMIKYLATINIMTYDFCDGSWGKEITTHQTNLYKTEYTEFSVEEAVDKMIRMGVPSTKIVIGVAYYSRGFSNSGGLAKPAKGGSTDKSWEAGIVDYKNLPIAGAKELYDEKAGAGYSYDAGKKIFNSYDTPRSVMEKCKYVNTKNLKGVIVWEASGDAVGARSLTKILYDNLGKTTVVPPPKPIGPPPAPPPPQKSACPFLSGKIKTMDLPLNTKFNY